MVFNKSHPGCVYVCVCKGYPGDLYSYIINDRNDVSVFGSPIVDYFYGFHEEIDSHTSI